LNYVWIKSSAGFLRLLIYANIKSIKQMGESDTIDFNNPSTAVKKPQHWDHRFLREDLGKCGISYLTENDLNILILTP